MTSHAIVDSTVALLTSLARSQWFSVLLGACAFLVTITLTLPVELLVALGVLISPLRWIAIGLWAAIGSSLASIGLYLAFHHIGWNLVLVWYPNIATSPFWLHSTTWLAQYGVIALFALMALPLPVPKTAALAFVALYRMPIYEVVLAIGLGKLLKYTVYAYLVSHFPRRLARWHSLSMIAKDVIDDATSQSIQHHSIGPVEK